MQYSQLNRQDQKPLFLGQVSHYSESQQSMCSNHMPPSSVALILTWVAGVLEPIPSGLGQEAGCTRNPSPANCKAHINKQTFHLESSIKLAKHVLGMRVKTGVL